MFQFGEFFKKCNGESFYGPYDAQELLSKYADEIGIKVVSSQAIVYVKANDNTLSGYYSIDEKPEGNIVSISGTELRDILYTGKTIRHQ